MEKCNTRDTYTNAPVDVGRNYFLSWASVDAFPAFPKLTPTEDSTAVMVLWDARLEPLATLVAPSCPEKSIDSGSISLSS
jgi:hypothetical protein